MGTSNNFPFGFVQLGTNAEQKTDNSPDSSWPLIRWHQTADHGVAPNMRMNHTFMSAAMDTHDPESPYGVIHPRDKLTVAKRLAWSGLALEYGRADLPSRGPQPTLIRYQILDLAFTGPLQWRWGLLGIQSGLRPVNHC